jgi:hypothetical protein
MRTFRVWDLFFIGALLLAAVQIGLLVRQRNALTDTPAAPPPEESAAEKVARELGAERDLLLRTVADLRSEAGRLHSQIAELEKGRSAEPASIRPGNLTAELLQAQLLVANDRLEKAYRDIAMMESELVEMSRKLESPVETSGGSGLHLGGDLTDEPKIDGVVLGVSDKVNLILISVGTNDTVQVGYKFTVYRGSEYVSKLIVDKVEDTWAACREIVDFRKSEIQQGDNVSTRVFD